MNHLRQCIVIGIEDGTERFSRIHLFSASEGYELALKRKSTRRAGTRHLDLFQTVEIVLDQKPDKAFSFLKETHTLAERVQIGKHYQTFEMASKFCRAVRLNARHMQEAESVYQLLEQSLNAWNIKTMAHTIFLKALFRLAAEEGFPVRQYWLGKMNEESRTEAEYLLSNPLDLLQEPELPAKHLALNLINWLTHHQDFMF